ncbi:MAG: hypothetical protein CVU07_09875, partial [Bacteroidetes bacterium HGW-Bacteroidetes-23]
MNVKIHSFFISTLWFSSFHSSVGKKQLFWFFKRWLSCRKKPNVLFVRLGQYETQRFAAWRSGGFLAQKFNR